jgi:enoyl-CoA hydratase/carnithine racemase
VSAATAGGISLERHPRHWHVRLARPPVNALDLEMAGLLLQAVRAAGADPACRALLLTSGVPGVFCAGADVSLLDGGAAGELDRFRRLVPECFSAIEELAVPVVAAVDGPAYGGGLELLLACDLVVAADRPAVRFGVPEVRLGLFPGAGGTQRLTRAVGRVRATRLMMTGEPLGAPEALAAGLVSELVDADSAGPRAAELAAALGSGPTVALAAIKRCVAAASAGLAAGLAVERREVQAVVASADAAEGVRAFLERRPPVFGGR